LSEVGITTDDIFGSPEEVENEINTNNENMRTLRNPSIVQVRENSQKQLSLHEQSNELFKKTLQLQEQQQIPENITKSKSMVIIVDGKLIEGLNICDTICILKDKTLIDLRNEAWKEGDNFIVLKNDFY